MIPSVSDNGVISRAQFAFDGTLAVPMYTLMFHDGDDVKPAASLTDQGSEEENQLLFATLFAGLAMDARTVSDTQAITSFPVATDVVAEIDCVSSTFEVGDMVAIDEHSGGTYLENQKVVKTTKHALAIGYVIKREANATTRVTVRFLSSTVRHALGQPIRPLVMVFDCETTDGTGTGEFLLLPGAANKNGLIYYDCFARVTEVFGGASQDQGIITVKDTSDNTLGTLTPSDSGADAAGDTVRSTNVAAAASTGTAIKYIAAGAGIKAAITQQCSGSGEAGKLELYLVVLPLLG